MLALVLWETIGLLCNALEPHVVEKALGGEPRLDARVHELLDDVDCLVRHTSPLVASKRVDPLDDAAGTSACEENNIDTQ
jgi:hypothetical protein